jgi:putative glutathione S-transferase
MMHKAWLGKESSSDGSFVKQESRFTTPFGAGAGTLPVEAGRYRLVWSRACPFAARQTIVLRLLGLEGAVSVGTVDPIRPRKEYRDWAFTLDPGGIDPALGIHFLSEAYLKADPSYRGRFTTPALIDAASGKVVNNDYANMTYYWEKEWKDFQKPDAPDLLPDDLREAIFALNEIIFRDINNGVYRAGFARSQSAYEEGYNAVFSRLDELEQRLSANRFLFGGRLTDSDVRLYATLSRFDIAYYHVFRCNKKRIRDYPALWRYAKELYNIPAFGENTDFDHIKRHYHLNTDSGNVYDIIPQGPDVSDWSQG